MPGTGQTLIAQYKQFLGQAALLTHTTQDCAAAHCLLGSAAREQIGKILARRLEIFGPERAAAQLRRARQYQIALKTKLQKPNLTLPLRVGIQTYFDSIAAWAEGARLGVFHHPFISEALDGIPITALDLAFFLQEDEVGCQTGTYRDRAGAIIFWHTEEDYEEQPGERFDRLRLFSFRAYEERVATAFIYPDLLPGPAFAWQTGYFIQAVDSLHPHEINSPDAILPNTFAWLSLYLGTSVTREELARELGPFSGGYSLTALGRVNGEVRVEKIEFANAQYHVSHLDEAAGCYFFQTNIIEDLSLPVGAQEKINPDSRAWNGARLARTQQHMRAIRDRDDALAFIFDMVRSQDDDGAYSNHDVKGYLVARVSPNKFSLWVGSGPAMVGDELLTIDND
jgi:hypothetical protein